MYKHTYTSTAERYLVNEKIQEEIYKGLEKIMNRIELSLLTSAYPDIDMRDTNNGYNNKENTLSRDIIRKRLYDIKNVNGTRKLFHLDKSKSKKLLIPLYEYYLREEMIQYVDMIGFEQKKEETKEKIDEDFYTYLKHKDEGYIYIEKFNSEIEKYFDNIEEIRKIYTDRPIYFLLYRIRNNLLKEVNESDCSEKYIRNCISDVKKEYRKLYLNAFNREYFTKIIEFENMKKEIFQHIEDGFLDCIKNGRYVNVGNKLANEFIEEIQKDLDYIELKKNVRTVIKFSDGYDSLIINYQEIQDKYNEIAARHIDKETKINKMWLEDDLNTFIQYCTTQYIYDSYDRHISKIELSEIGVIEDKIIEYMKKKIEKRKKYDVFVKIENIDLKDDDEIKYNNLMFVSGKFLKEQSDKYLKYKCTEFEEKFFDFDNIKKDDVYVVIQDIEAYRTDSTFLCEYVLGKIDRIINLINFYTGREKSKNYRLDDKMLIVENGAEYKLKSYASANSISFIPIIEDKWISNVYHDDKKIVNRVIESISEYNRLKNEKIINYRGLIESNRSLFNECNIEKLSRDMSIFIAGTNIFGYTRVEYLKLRLWLIEDYIEFLNNELPNDRFVYERFLNFYKRAINIILSYTDTESVALIKDIENWILKIFPNDYVFEGDNGDA